MKTLRNLIVMSGIAAVSAAASAQMISGPGNGSTIGTIGSGISYLTNVILDPGFEKANTYDYWDGSNSYIYNWGSQDDFETILGFRSNSHVHSGSYSYNMGVENWSWSELFHSVMYQPIAPLAGSKVVSAGVWVYTFGQSLNAAFTYSDGSSSSATVYFSGATWTLWNLKPYINTNKTLVGVQFTAESSQYGSGNTIWIDDAYITKYLTVALP